MVALDDTLSLKSKTERYVQKPRQYKGKGNLVFLLSDKRTAIAIGELQFLFIVPTDHHRQCRVAIEDIREAIVKRKCRDLNTLAGMMGVHATWKHGNRKWL